MSNVSLIAPTQQVIDTRFTQDVIPILDTAKFEHMQRIASVMAKCGHVPLALRLGEDHESRMASCFRIVNQAVRWEMDPFCLAECAYVISGKLAYEGKVIAAAVNSDHRLKGRLDYAFDGEGELREIIVSGTFRDTGETKIVKGTVKLWKTGNGQWKADPDQMLVYRGSRQWARRWLPDRLLGIYSNDELEEIAARDIPNGQRAVRMRDVTPPRPAAPPPDDIPDEPAPAAIAAPLASANDIQKALEASTSGEQMIALMAAFEHSYAALNDGERAEIDDLHETMMDGFRARVAQDAS